MILMSHSYQNLAISSLQLYIKNLFLRKENNSTNNFILLCYCYRYLSMSVVTVEFPYYEIFDFEQKQNP